MRVRNSATKEEEGVNCWGVGRLFFLFSDCVASLKYNLASWNSKKELESFRSMALGGKMAQ